jgi:hypothetical protein
LGTFIGAIRVNEGIVVVSDIESNQEKEPNVVKLTNSCIVLFLDDLEACYSFYEEVLRPQVNEQTSFEQIQKLIIDFFKISPPKYKDKLITSILIGYDPFFQDRDFLIIKFNGTNTEIVQLSKYTTNILFSLNDQLGRYIASKVYSPTMSLERTTNILGYIAVQYNVVHKTGKKIRMGILSEKGFSELSAEIINQVLQNVGEIDRQIKKSSCKLFVKEHQN